MQNAEKLMTEFTEKYMDKLFYFCLKKTGDSYEAEDLSSDISLCIFTQLRKGTIPENFPAWVWQIARNRYCKWAEYKRKKAESVTGADTDNLELLDDILIEDEILRKEDLSLLRRELAFISSDYRDIVVAYYIHDRSVKDIASSLNLPKGTVMSKLFRARNILKEGMSMAKEFGVRSYKPEEISFTNSCSSMGDKGQPWSILYHSMYKNIFLEVYDNPETAEEVSLQLGVALPYMKDELEFLTHQTFLVKHNDRYETAFPIISRDAQEKIHKKIVNVSEEVTVLLEKTIDLFNSACERAGCTYFGNYQNFKDAKWTLLMHAFDLLTAVNKDEKPFKYTKRPDNGNWDIVGYQQADIIEPPFVGLHGYMNVRKDRPFVHFQQYKYQIHGIDGRTPNFITHEDALTLKMVAEGKWEACEQHFINNLLNYGYIRKDGKGFVPCIIVFSGYGIDQYLSTFNETEKTLIHDTTKKIKRIIADINSYAREITRDDLPKSFRTNEHFCEFALMNSGMDRKYILAKALEHGWLQYDDSTSRVIGAYLYI